ncbi:hypothetical protein PR048_002992 [Dryococelus australis]|uniref:Uncharacterized protein n=1 Tax=Dryococelus australis TaxID=614101 RepID=A0ABQ9ILS1_9NEOP|nr:hypothetical protein PR048_002992 [Dryococelus australis]
MHPGVDQLPTSCRRNIRRITKQDIVPRKQNCTVNCTAAICCKLSTQGAWRVEKAKARARKQQTFNGSRCRTCEKFRRANQKEPLIPHEVPRLPYLKVGADILEEAGNAFLVLIEYYSQWLHVRP